MSLVRSSNCIQRICWTKPNISWSRLMSSSQPVPSKPEEPKAPSNNPHLIPGVGDRANYKPDNLERKFLVWTGKYKSVDEIPDYINQEAMERTRNKIRIKGANIMMLLTVIGCVFMVYSGKKAAEAGESVEKQNLEWHKAYKNEAKPSSQ